MNHKIAPSLLSANFGNLKADIDMVNKSEADWLHIEFLSPTYPLAFRFSSM